MIKTFLKASLARKARKINKKYRTPRISPWVIKGLDRLYLKRVCALRTVRLRVNKFKNARLVSQSLRYVGPVGSQVGRSARLVRGPLLALPPQKYRLKSNGGANLHAELLRANFQVRPLHGLKRWRRRYAATYKMPTSTRKRALLHFTNRVWRHGLLLRRVLSPHIPRQIYLRRRLPWMCKLPPEHVPPVVRLPKADATRLEAFRYRLNRINARGVEVSKFRRWWWKKKEIKRRRRRGKRLFAGVFGRRRWRLERRDKFLLKRDRQRYPVKRKTLYRVSRANISLHVARWNAKCLGRRAALLEAARLNCKLSRMSRAYVFAPLDNLCDRVPAVPGLVPKPERARKTSSRLDYQQTCLREKAGVGLLRRTFSVTTPKKAPLLAHVVRSRHLQTSPSLPKEFLNPRVSTWGVVRAAHKLLLQRHLRTSALSATSSGNAHFAGGAAADNAISSHTKLLRNTLLRTVAYVPATRVAPRRALLFHVAPLLPRVLASGLPLVNTFQQSNFLKKSTNYPTAAMRPTVNAALQAALTVTQQRRRYKELRFYHRRPRIRLPGLSVTRARRRKGGFVTFAQNSLKRPQTLRGQQNLLLPPVGAYAGLVSNYSVKKQTAIHVLTASERRDDAWPQFWKRPHTRANIKAINRVRRRQYLKLKRRYILRRKKQAKQRRTALLPLSGTNAPQLVLPLKGKIDPSIAQQSAAKLATIRELLGRVNMRSVKGVQPRRALLRLLPRARGKGAKHKFVVPPSITEARRTNRYLNPVLSRVTEWNTLLPKKQTVTTQKMQGLWQGRSVQKMLTAERSLSAWSPQLSVRNRRAHSPRVNGVPRPRRWLGFTAKRERRNFNAKLLARNIPQRRYTDHTAIKLQYYYGSVSSVGYTRFRRVHRLHSDHSRWWRANKVAVPFAHPFSRRALNAKRYRRLDLARARVPKYRTLERLTRDVRGSSPHSKYPPRTIPWRNFRYPRPRRGRTPRTLRRWTFTTLTGKTGRIAPGKERLVVRRSAREMRSLEQYISSRSVWKDRRWTSLDKIACAASVNGQLFAAVRVIPATAWKALQGQAGSPAAYAAIHAGILFKFRSWLRKRQDLTTTPILAATQQAQLFLINLLADTLKADSQRIASSVSAAQRHSTLRVGAFDKRVASKAMQFLRLRVLPGLDAASGVESVLQREHSSLYKRWLHGVETASKRAQFGYTPASRSRYTANVATAFARRRARFPGSGRRHKSYDSLLHAFVRKTSPARFRRASSLRFKQVLPRLSTDFRENLLINSAIHGLNRRRALARRSSQTAYLSAPWRELIGYRTTVNKEPALVRTAPGAKRRFLSLPLRAVFSDRSAQALRAVSPYKQQMRVIRAGILRRALRRRREERAYVDLRHSALQRRLPKEQASRSWKLQRAAKRRQAAKIGPYSHYTVRARAAIPGRWTLVHLSAVGPRREYLELAPLPQILPSGEHVSVMSGRLCKDKRAFRGFVLPIKLPRRRKLRRQVRDTRKRRRVSRRSKRASRLAAFRNTKHWSEKKDRRFRNTALSRKRGSFAKKLSRALIGKLENRYGITHTRKGTNRLAMNRLARFTLGAQAAAADALRKPLDSTPSASTLTVGSSLRRRARVTRLRSKSKFAALRYRAQPLTGLVLRKKRFYDSKFAFRVQHRLSIAEKLVSRVGAECSVTSLWFQKPATRVVKSELAKEKEALAEIAMKEDRYKITAQYVESLTAFIPELMNHMLSKKIEKGGRGITYKTAQHLVRNIYWSLRVYLNVDPFDIRFFARDKRAAVRVQLFETISDLSEGQQTEQPQRAALRYRFQPGKVLLAPNTMRFRGDWLRAFFPARHALYQENPEDYGKFLFKTRRIRRLRIGPRGMDSWSTTHQIVNHETRARQLLNLRFSRTRARFETILQTTRRLPQRECAPLTGALSSRNSFFKRRFSTYANRGLALTSRWIHRKKRFIALESGWRTLSPLALVTARNRAIPHVEARGRTNYVATKWSAISNGLLDLRFVRSKSPRSRQYLIRTPKNLLQLNKTEKLANLVFYRELLSQRFIPNTLEKRRWTRVNRRTSAETLKGRLSHRKNIMLQTLRASYRTRRAQAALHFRRAHLFGVARNSTRSARAETLQKLVRRPQGFKEFSLSTVRPILQHRIARARTSSVTYQKPLALSQAAVAPGYSFLRMRKVWMYRCALSEEKKLFRPRLRQAVRSKRFTPSAKLSKISNPPLGAARQVRSARTKRAGAVSYFRTGTGRQNLRGAAFARACALYTKFYRQTPFETHRPRLWDRLSQRWMKKFRIGRYWLRDTGRWLRDPWLSEIVACDMSLRPDRLGGELRSRPQKVGEYVAEVDAKGRDIRRKDAPKERHKFQQKILPTAKETEVKKTNRVLKRGPVIDRIVTRHRLGITREARRKPVPTLRLANYEYRDVIREHKENKAKSAKQKGEEEALRVKAYWVRKAKKLPPVRPRRLPLKHPANLWLPHVIWKEIQRRIRRFEWRESDEVFFRRGFRTAFQFYPNERRKTPWLEHLMYTRATYSTRLREFRRRQYPHEQKKFKWLQRVRKMLYPGRRARYIKWRRWPQLRRYNQKLHYSLFNLRDRGAARRHFKRLNGRTRPAVSAFVSMSRGLTDRLDVTCFQMGVAPSIYWARIVTEFGLLRVNGSTVYDPSYRIKPADVIYPNWDTIARFQHYFKPHLKAREEYQRRNRASTAFYPTNMEYHPGIRAFVYKHAPEESDLRRSSRIRPAYFRWFKLDSV